MFRQGTCTNWYFVNAFLITLSSFELTFQWLQHYGICALFCAPNNKTFQCFVLFSNGPFRASLCVCIGLDRFAHNKLDNQSFLDSYIVAQPNKSLRSDIFQLFDVLIIFLFHFPFFFFVPRFFCGHKFAYQFRCVIFTAMYAKYSLPFYLKYRQPSR